MTPRSGVSAASNYKQMSEEAYDCTMQCLVVLIACLH
jgi:hypothetical protein